MALTLTACGRAIGPVQRGRRDHGSLALCLEGRGSQKKLFLAMGGKLFMPSGNPLMTFPGLYINLNLGNEKGEGGSQGSVVNHVGSIVDDVPCAGPKSSVRRPVATGRLT